MFVLLESVVQIVSIGELGHYEYLPVIGGYGYIWCVFECREALADRACNCTRRESAFFDPDMGTTCSELDALFCAHATFIATGSLRHY